MFVNDFSMLHEQNAEPTNPPSFMSLGIAQRHER